MEPDAPWLQFSFPDFCFAFLSILFEGVPFLLLGTLISGLIDQFLPARIMTRFLPRNAATSIFLGGLMGIAFPMCECGIVPVIRRLIRKGLPPAPAITYMLAAPIVNPVVALSTFVAFRGQGALEMTSLRMAVGYLVAVLVGFVVLNLPLKRVLTPGVLDRMAPDDDNHAHERQHHDKPRTFVSRLLGASRVAISDFLDVLVYFVLGAAIAATFNTSVNQEVILPLALEPWLATYSMMGLAAILTLCSTSDAFIAATLHAFPAVSKLAFLVFGPMIDLKLIFIYGALFRKTFIAALAVGLYILIGLICMRIAFLQL